jgi:hypothetical protein
MLSIFPLISGIVISVKQDVVAATGGWLRKERVWLANCKTPAIRHLE